MANITRYDPFNDLVDDIFKGFLVRPVAYEGGRSEGLPRVKVDVAEQNGAYKVTAELPGVKKDDIQITIDGDTVAVGAEVRNEKDVKNGDRVLRSERYYGKVYRAFTLGQAVEEGSVQAKYADGVLELTLPKKQAAPRKQITIQ